MTPWTNRIWMTQKGLDYLNNGIAIYPGLDNTVEENLALIDTAAAAGITRVFTSMHIPESDHHALKEEIGTLLSAARAHHMEVISDVSPQTLGALGLKTFTPSKFRMLGITTVRMDYGFSPQEIARISHNNQNIRIQLNASTLTPHILHELADAKADFSRIDAMHNFYPRIGTGLSEALLVRRNAPLHSLGIRVGAFVTTRDGRRRSPYGEGLPTLEAHRRMPPAHAARHLVALGIDSVILADSLPTEEEIRTLGSLQDNCVTLEAELLTSDPAVRELLSHTFTSRVDAARDAVRAQESRIIIAKAHTTIAPAEAHERTRGTITIDNKTAGRYMGELDIMKRTLPADPRVNVCARIIPEDLPLLGCITPGRKFSFILHSKNASSDDIMEDNLARATRKDSLHEQNEHAAGGGNAAIASDHEKRRAQQGK